MARTTDPPIAAPGGTSSTWRERRSLTVGTRNGGLPAPKLKPPAAEFAIYTSAISMQIAGEERVIQALTVFLR
jgi:hypothetical protein